MNGNEARRRLRAGQQQNTQTESRPDAVWQQFQRSVEPLAVAEGAQRDKQVRETSSPDSEPVIKERGAIAMHAIIETGGKQYKVAEGDVLFIEKLPQEAGDAIKFDKVLAILDEQPKFGAPLVEGASVDASVVKNGKGKKVVIFKYKPKKGYRLRQGHRQPYTKVEIKKINA